MPFGKKKGDSGTGVLTDPAPAQTGGKGSGTVGQVIVGGETFYEVEKILGKKFNKKGKPIYLVKWKGYGPSENTWEPLENLETVQDLVDEYEKTHKDTKKAITKASPKPSSKGDVSDKKKNGKASAGSFANGDEPAKILEFSLTSDHKKPSLKEAMFKVDWKKRSNGEAPEPSNYSAQDLRKLAPNVLLDFYEERITFLWDEDK